MSRPVEGFNERSVAIDPDGQGARIDVDEAFYPVHAVLGAAHTFLERAFLHLDRPGAGRLRVTLRPRDGSGGEEALRALVGEFANELLACAFRQRLTRQNRAALHAATRRAIARAMGPKTEPNTGGGQGER
jgi:His-Xaa-Ser system protein HxsD